MLARCCDWITSNTHRCPRDLDLRTRTKTAIRVTSEEQSARRGIRVGKDLDCFSVRAERPLPPSLRHDKVSYRVRLLIAIHTFIAMNPSVRIRFYNVLTRLGELAVTRPRVVRATRER